MHNLVSYNQLAGSYEEEHDTRLTEYYECLINVMTVNLSVNVYVERF